MKKNFKKFVSRSVQKHREKREMLRLVKETNVNADHAKFGFCNDESPRAHRNKSAIKAEGIFREASGGFGFVSVDGEERDVFIPEREVKDAIDGDLVAITYKRYTSDSGEIRTEGRITEIKEYGSKTVIGTVDSDVIRLHKKRTAILYLIPDNGRIKRRIFLRETNGAMEGDKVSVKLIRDPFSYALYADVTANFGLSSDKGANYAAILADNEIDTEFTKDELLAAHNAAAEDIKTEGRAVYEDVIFTIDSESAKDLDDAISVKRRADGGFILGVHIADVSHYVTEKTALDRLVMRRGTSVYFTDKVVPMLPEDLSNGACSLNPGEYKYTLSAIINLDCRGEIEDAKIERSVIKSRLKGIYSEINRIFEGTADGELIEKYKELLPTLEVGLELYRLLAKKAEARGYIELESDEAQIILDADGTPTDIVRRERGDAEKLIEQFMLTANEAVATTLIELGIPCVFRIHEKPSFEKLSEFITYASNLGLNTSGLNPEACEPKQLAVILREAREKGISDAVSYACLRSMAKATYSEVHIPHFGLGLENYCHFTSPIRRLSDLATHRIINSVIFDKKPSEKYKSYAKRAAAAATDGELRAVAAERKIENLYKVIYMSDKIGNEYRATVRGINQYGIFAALENTCEGLIPISELDGHFIYDEGNITMRSKNSVLHIGDTLTVKLEEADMIKGKLRFSMVESNEE